MARGWESKDVASQRESREQAQLSKNVSTPAQQKQRNSLLLQRARIVQEMQTACNPRFRAQLEAALAHLDGELARLNPIT